MNTLKKAPLLAILATLGMATAGLAQTTTETPAPVAADSTAPGPYAGWPVISSDGHPVGVVDFSPEDIEGDLAFIVVRDDQGRVFKLTNGIALVGQDSITIRLSKEFIDRYNSDNFTNIVIQ